MNIFDIFSCKGQIIFLLSRLRPYDIGVQELDIIDCVSVLELFLERYKDADTVITIEGKEYALYKNGPLNKYPYMIDLSTGEIPQGKQRSSVNILGKSF